MKPNNYERFANSQEKIVLDETECCALANAFAKNPGAVSALEKTMDPKKLRTSADILINTTGIGFQRNHEVDWAYSQIAEAELARLEKTDNAAFHCEHSAEDHEDALRSVLDKVKETAN